MRLATQYELNQAREACGECGCSTRSNVIETAELAHKLLGLLRAVTRAGHAHAMPLHRCPCAACELLATIEVTP